MTDILKIISAYGDACYRQGRAEAELTEHGEMGHDQAVADRAMNFHRLVKFVRKHDLESRES